MKQKLLLGYDIGSSSIKSSLIDADSGELMSSVMSPEQEMKIDAPKIGWAEQHPDKWWNHVRTATQKMLSKLSSTTYEIIGIGISYQMHGLVIVDKDQNVLYPSIIWCDSRAVETGNIAFNELGSEYCLSNYLNSPGNFTASKLNWVKNNLPEVYSKIYKFMLPGDYIAMRLSGEINTTISGLSEGIFWNFNNKKPADKLIEYYGFDENIIPAIAPSFGIQSTLSSEAANELGLQEAIPIAYRAGDQPNNALSLNVLNPGEIAATAGTSGVIYGVTAKNVFDNKSRVNTFAHVNYTNELPNKGVLLCINGTGIQYSWLKQNIIDNKFSYNELNDFAESVNIGSDGLLCHPFGNGAERVLQNKNVNAHFSGINFNLHGIGHMIRSAQEGIAFAFKYGLDVMESIGMETDNSTGRFKVIRAGNSNLFQSKVFRDAFVNTCNVDLEIYNTDGAQGAARGAGIGIGYYTPENAFKGLKKIEDIKPDTNSVDCYHNTYEIWKEELNSLLKNKPLWTTSP
ncbi:MAG: FGGY family carbohydrate kinase [Ignavibacteria bacterium]|jgi:xylulokinase